MLGSCLTASSSSCAGVGGRSSSGVGPMLAPVFTHPRCLDHDPGAGHPESPARLRTILERVRRADPIAVRDAPPAPRAAVERVHPRTYLDRLEQGARAGGGRLDPDT